MDPLDFVVRRAERGGWDGAAGPGVGRSTDGSVTLLYVGSILRIDGKRVSDRSSNAIAELLLAKVRDDDAAFASVIGGFSACVVEGERLSAFRSLAGSQALYSTEDRIATRLAALVEGVDALRLDPAGVLAYLFDARSLGYASPRVPIAGARLVPPGAVLRAEGRGSFVTRFVGRRTYSYGADSRTPREQVTRELRETVDAIVSDIVAGYDAGHVTCEVSGGLDSSFTAALAGKHRPGARALMYAWPDKPSHRICERDARDVAKHASLELEVLAPEDLGDFDVERGVGYSDMPSSWYWYRALMAGGLGSRTPSQSLVLSGYGSDQLFMRSRAIVPRLVRQGNLREAHRIARAAAKQGSRSETHLLVQSAISLLPKRVYSAMSTRFANARFNPFEIVDLESMTAAVQPIPWLSVPQEKIAILAEELEREGEAADGRTLGRDHFCSSDLSYLVAPSQLVGRDLGRRDVRYESPYLDHRLFEFVAQRVPLAMVHDFEGPPKALLREAMRDVVPEVVRTRTGTFFHWSGYMGRFVDRHAAALKALLAEAEVFDIGVDLRAVSAAFEQLRFGVNDASTQRLHHLIGLILWWRAFRADVAANVSRGAANESFALL